MEEMKGGNKEVEEV